MKPIIRWSTAGLVTIAAFAATTWICGALILPAIMKDSATRWGVAGALGVAVAALAALWGHSFATTEQPVKTAPHGDLDSTPTITTTESGDIRNKISGGTFHGPVTQGRDISGPISGRTPPQNPGPGTRG